MNNEPVAWRNLCVSNIGEDSEWIYNEIGQGEPLYTHPAKEYKPNQTLECSFDLAGFKPLAKTLTDEEIIEIWSGMETDTGEQNIIFARAILRKAQEK